MSVFNLVFDIVYCELNKVFENRSVLNGLSALKGLGYRCQTYFLLKSQNNLRFNFSGFIILSMARVKILKVYLPS